MAKQPQQRLFTYLGLVTWGDFGALTMYRRPDRRLVIFEKTWPDKPPSVPQILQREAFARAAATWNALTRAQRRNWSTAAARASLCATGFNLYAHWFLTGDNPAIRTIERHTHTHLIP